MTHFTRNVSASRRLAVLAGLVLLGLAACQEPTVVIEDAVAAARSGDREAYAACFTRRSRPILEAFWAATDEHNPPLGALGAGAVQINSVRLVDSRELDGERALVTVEEGGDRLRLVLHRSGGNWRIDILDTERALMGLTSF